MSYTPTEWKSGDVVTAAKLNKIEDGIANAVGGVLIAQMDSATGTLNKTYSEIAAADFAVVKIIESSGIITLPIINYGPGSYTAYEVTTIPFGKMPDGIVFTAAAENAYPVFASPSDPTPIE